MKFCSTLTDPCMPFCDILIRYLQIPVAVIIANIARNYSRDNLVVSFLCICRFLGYACIPLVIKSSNAKSIEFFSSSALTDKRIPAANKAMRIAPISSELPSRAVGNILDVTAAARSLDRQPVTPSDRFRARANRPTCSSPAVCMCALTRDAVSACPLPASCRRWRQHRAVVPSRKSNGLITLRHHLLPGWQIKADLM